MNRGAPCCFINVIGMSAWIYACSIYDDIRRETGCVNCISQFCGRTIRAKIQWKDGAASVTKYIAQMILAATNQQDLRTRIGQSPCH
jgi:hypothetical protein